MNGFPHAGANSLPVGAATTSAVFMCSGPLSSSSPAWCVFIPTPQVMPLFTLDPDCAVSGWYTFTMQLVPWPNSSMYLLSTWEDLRAEVLRIQGLWSAVSPSLGLSFQDLVPAIESLVALQTQHAGMPTPTCLTQPQSQCAQSGVCSGSLCGLHMGAPAPVLVPAGNQTSLPNQADAIFSVPPGSVDNHGAPTGGDSEEGSAETVKDLDVKNTTSSSPIVAGTDSHSADFEDGDSVSTATGPPCENEADAEVEPATPPRMRKVYPPWQEGRAQNWVAIPLLSQTKQTELKEPQLETPESVQPDQMEVQREPQEQQDSDFVAVDQEESDAAAHLEHRHKDLLEASVDPCQSEPDDLCQSEPDEEVPAQDPMAAGNAEDAAEALPEQVQVADSTRDRQGAQSAMEDKSKLLPPWLRSSVRQSRAQKISGRNWSEAPASTKVDNSAAAKAPVLCSEPIQAAVAALDISVFDGCWLGKDGHPVARIKTGTLTWVEDEDVAITALSQTMFEMTYLGRVFTATHWKVGGDTPDTLLWCDGDCWSRSDSLAPARKPGQPSNAAVVKPSPVRTKQPASQCMAAADKETWRTASEKGDKTVSGCTSMQRKTTRGRASVMSTPINERNYKGTIKWFRGTYGWVESKGTACEFPDLDVFIHINDCQFRPRQWDEVSFRLAVDESGGPKAVRVTLQPVA